MTMAIGIGAVLVWVGICAFVLALCVFAARSDRAAVPSVVTTRDQANLPTAGQFDLRTVPAQSRPDYAQRVPST